MAEQAEEGATVRVGKRVFVGVGTEGACAQEAPGQPAPPHARGPHPPLGLAAETQPAMPAPPPAARQNLAWRTSWQDLKDRFRESGNVVYSNVMKDEEGEQPVDAQCHAAAHTSQADCGCC